MGEDEVEVFVVRRLAFGGAGREGVVEVGAGGELPDGVELLELVEGVNVPRTVHATVTRDGWPFDVSVVVWNGEHDGRVLSVQVLGDDGVSVTTSHLRAVTVDAIVRWVQTAAMAVCSSPARAAATVSGEERLERAAGLYRLAMVLHEEPTAFVAGALEVSRSTAGRLVRECRDRGLLGPALGTVAGELREED